MAILNSSGTSVVTYTYDAWGRLLTTSGSMASTLGVHNPLRYRGYVYDTESGLYYLQSRYYNPELGRFINADALASTGQGILGNNMFAYCNNNPIIAADPKGEWLNVVIGAGIGAIAGLIGQVISDVVTSVVTQTPTISNWQTYAGAAIGGAAGGAVLATTGNVNAANAVTGFATTGTAQTLEKVTGVNDRSWEEIGTNSARDGAVSLALGSFLSGIPNVTTGKNSMMAVYQSGLTKLRNDVAKTMSTSVMAKGLVASVAGGLYLDGYYGLMQARPAN